LIKTLLFRAWNVEGIRKKLAEKQIPPGLLSSVIKRLYEEKIAQPQPDPDLPPEYPKKMCS